jgi:glycine cleavage system aminomethyltransferase T
VKWEVRGPQATDAVQRVFTGDVAGQVAGQVRYGAFTDEDGRLIDDGTVFKHADDHYWVFTNTSGIDGHWAAHTGDLDVEYVNRVHQMPLVSVQGPRSRDLLSALTGADVSWLRYFRFLPERVDVAGAPVWLMRTGFSGELGYELVPDPDGANALWAALGSAGAVPIGLDTVEPARIEAGLIIYSTDYTPGVHTPFDVSMDAVVALSSGADFVGRDALAAVAPAPPNRLKTLVLSGRELPDAGAQVLDAGRPVGTLSSRVLSPRFGAIGLAMLASGSAVDGHEVTVEADGTAVAARVAPLSVKDPGKARVRS